MDCCLGWTSTIKLSPCLMGILWWSRPTDGRSANHGVDISCWEPGPQPRVWEQPGLSMFKLFNKIRRSNNWDMPHSGVHSSSRGPRFSCSLIYVIKTQRQARNPPSRGLWVPWGESLRDNMLSIWSGPVCCGRSGGQESRRAGNHQSWSPVELRTDGETKQGDVGLVRPGGVISLISTQPCQVNIGETSLSQS